ncbi:mannose-1-phosphate guanylyltransferase/mannose-6-phosphate isomerase [Aureimonas phyllosphaerae]|uniref:mannose-1-phosphate guanylyltransferase n=1 Tax=Aureimonas phyllosphaerae TaxID=1166078 RepID=A0A7W6BUX6_9HYPH|nr:mannose-1-phosphate guanylyltransferase/mannose-6-phosphate isomerase [Aureimonas phyllosphaerae]MBB3936755.1 mannose-1-phosphate guanylyltransferase/mannose-6-phosphate isomerase [Aureimonas phyllosphaerae]MBB3960382.1 mannose-1-phosphate guanylyltransferase/mannose-6-phosphate isomerase [Aureimonas phyllosphaerae]SFF22285.1 mannose-1-phosphate guanylyltransferase / mannose-6-phosphate isomerase [Aureimonas phyllosphaerae]
MTVSSRARQVHPVVIAGGSGTRLWPVSRDTMPKQFVSLLDSGRSTFEETILRVSGQGFARPVVVTHSDFRFVVAEQLAGLGVEADIVLEPERRDSAAAIAVGALIAAGRDEDAVCLVLAADHLIPDGDLFTADCQEAAAAAAGFQRIMLLGIEPTGPSTAYGYIAPGAPLGDSGAFTVERFAEKPNRETAETYVAEGYRWNSGNFVFPARLMQEELSTYAPEVLNAARGALEAAVRDLDFLRLDADAFARAPRISIDYAVMEKTRRAGVLKTRFRWSDIGSWDAMFDVKDKDAAGNVLEGAVSVLDTHGSFVRSDEVLTTVVGLDDVVVVTTPDAVLVTSRERAGEVKSLVAKLHAEKRPEAGQHHRIHRPWGWYQRIDIGDRFQVKHICVKPGGILSLQRHYHRAEHWVVVRGTAEVTVDGAVKLFHENEAAYLPIGCTHRLHNPGKIPLKLIEVQVGSYTGEDDIVRIEDIYARN